MNRTIQKWLLTCPTVRRMSALVLDAHLCGMIDLAPALAKAIAVNVRAQSMLSERLIAGDHYYERCARLTATCRRRAHITVMADAAVLEAALARGVAVSQSRSRAVLHLQTPLPEIVLTATPGKKLVDLVDTPLFRRREYIVDSAAQDHTGCYFWFDVPMLQLPKRQTLLEMLAAPHT